MKPNSKLTIVTKDKEFLSGMYEDASQKAKWDIEHLDLNKLEYNVLCSNTTEIEFRNHQYHKEKIIYEDVYSIIVWRKQ